MVVGTVAVVVDMVVVRVVVVTSGFFVVGFVSSMVSGLVIIMSMPSTLLANAMVVTVSATEVVAVVDVWVEVVFEVVDVFCGNLVMPKRV